MKTDPAPQPQAAAALVSVGGSPAPVLHVLWKHRPPRVWYFCSAGTRANAAAIQAELDWHPQARFIEVERFEELGPCYRALRQKIPEIVAETKVKPAEVLVDYTGGTKTMSAALVLAATEWFDQFSYVGGTQREQGGLGVTVDGKEKVHYQGNPWSDLGIREVERARDLWAGCQFEAAARILRAVATRVSHQLRFAALADLADAMAARHRLDFRKAKTLLDPLQGKLPQLFDGRNDHGLLETARNARDACQACSGDTASEMFIRELLDNALRTDGQGRHEDAAARLYRAMEMQGQLWLAEHTSGIFKNGKCTLQDFASLPEPLKALAFCQPDEAGEIKFSLEQCFRALAALDHDAARAVVADLEAKDASGQTRSRWRAATEKRNTSILAHGVSPTSADGFAQMKQIAADFLGFDLMRETNPIPPLDTRWFE